MTRGSERSPAPSVRATLSGAGASRLPGARASGPDPADLQRFWGTGAQAGNPGRTDPGAVGATGTAPGRLGTLPEPSWWRGERPLTAILLEVWSVVGPAAARQQAALEREGISWRYGRPLPERPQSAEAPAGGAAVPAAGRARPLVLPGLAAALGVAEELLLGRWAKRGRKRR